MIGPSDLKNALKLAEKTLTYGAYVDTLRNPFRVVVATLLSARTKDETSAKASEKLFKTADTPKKVIKLTTKQIEDLIYPVSFYKNKARFISRLSHMILEDYKGKVPRSIEELVKLPGVGRKTANLVLSVAFRKAAVCVDTHVHRILNRWGTVETETPLETEMEIRRVVEKKLWSKINQVLVPFGKQTCTPISPFCSRCPLNQDCSKINVEKFR